MKLLVRLQEDNFLEKIFNFEKSAPTWFGLLVEDEVAELPVALLLMIGFLFGCGFVLEDVEEGIG